MANVVLVPNPKQMLLDSQPKFDRRALTILVVHDGSERLRAVN